MEYTVYILYSKSIEGYYVGQTKNLEDRLRRHNNSGSKSTKKANDRIVVYKELHPTHSAAVQRELEIKPQKSRRYIEELINGKS